MKVRHDARGAASVHGACTRSRDDASAQRTVASPTTSVIVLGVAPLMVNNARRLSNVIGGEKGINGFVLDPFQPLSGTKTATQIPSWKVSRSLFVKGICPIAHTAAQPDITNPHGAAPRRVQRAPTRRQAPHSIHIHITSTTQCTQCGTLVLPRSTHYVQVQHSLTRQDKTTPDKTRQDKGCLDLAAPHDRIAPAKATALLRRETQDTSAKQPSDYMTITSHRPFGSPSRAWATRFPVLHTRGITHHPLSTSNPKCQERVDHSPTSSLLRTNRCGRPRPLNSQTREGASSIDGGQAVPLLVPGCIRGQRRVPSLGQGSTAKCNRILLFVPDTAKSIILDPVHARSAS
ncbi:hypothetical protein BGZ61DRAFT_470887 [Ilyonectria robusta]|uniref:uncharacterized protein n=1 Tax=Ilyonectria robusta TaxID=1079257 RepID=UPI001E8DC675|nr:uncharacterized protein BGZ61DRAFT_470887 [Ilyonectria robusta]KAH8737443.1 hypothetical protein BGZ61DRAFT_470887 [Ilyonectria robusta]